MITTWNTFPSDRNACGKAYGANWLLWLKPFIAQPERGLELGTFKGESAEWFLDHILTHPSSSLVCVDTFEGGQDHKAHGVDCSNLRGETDRRLSRFGHRAIIRSMTTEAFFINCPWREFAFVYVDASHVARDVLSDLVHVWPLVKIGGIVICDDYKWREMPDELDRPQLAIAAFLRIYSRELEVLKPLGWQIAFRKMS